MPDYRDDIAELAWARDALHMGLASPAESTAWVSDTLLTAVRIMHADTVRAGEDTFDRALHAVSEQARATDAVRARLRARDLLADALAVGDEATGIAGGLLVETARGADGIIERLRAMTAETTCAADRTTGQRRTRDAAAERARVRDALLGLVRQCVPDAARAADAAITRARARQTWGDPIAAGDAVIDTRAARVMLVTETARALDAALGTSTARDVTGDYASAADALPGQPGLGQAWTANTQNWATSRYAPYPYTAVALINGQLYAQAADGVYALADGDEAIDAHIATAPLDLGQGALVRPRGVYLEYALQGSATLAVTQTQDGQAPVTWTYALPAEAARVRTNGRFVLGRGLRGRFFSFILRLKGARGHLEDFMVSAEPTQRRV